MTNKIFRFVLTVVAGLKCADLAFAKISIDEQDVDIIANLGDFYSSRYFVFLHDEARSESVRKAVKTISSRKLYTSAISLKNLYGVFANENAWKYFLESKILIATTMGRLNFTEILQNVPSPKSIVWTVFSRSFEDFEKFNIPPNAEVVGIVPMPEKMVIKRLYKINSQAEMVYEDFGFWTKSRLFITFIKTISRRIDFRNTSLKILLHEKSNGENCIRSQNLVLFKLRCFHTELVEIFSRTLNFNLNATKYVDIKHPYFNENGSFSEVFMALENNEFDLSGCTYVVSNERKMAFDYVWPTFSFRSMLYVKNEPGNRFWKAFLKPFNFKIYMVILVWIISSGLITQVFRGIRTKNFKIRPLTLVKSILMFLQVFCNQGFPHLSRWCSDRIIHMSTLLFMIIIYQGYCAKLISSITVIAPQIPFLTFNDFVRDGSYRLMTLKEGFHRIVFVRYVKHLKLEHLMLNIPDLPVHSTEAISKLCSNDRLTYVEFRENVAQYDLPCDIIEIPKPFFYYFMGLGLVKKSPYTQFFNHEITRLQSTGIINRMKRHLLAYEKLKNNEDKGFISVSLQQVSFAFFVLNLGIATSLLILAVEILCAKRSSKRLSIRPYWVEESVMKKEKNRAALDDLKESTTIENNMNCKY